MYEKRFLINSSHEMKDPIQQLKIWAFPTLISLLSAMIWLDVKEIRRDVKNLIVQSSIDRTKIEGLEKQVDILNTRVLYKDASVSAWPLKDEKREPLALLINKELMLEARKKKIQQTETV